MTSPLSELLEDIEEEIAAGEVLCLYHFTWGQNIGSRPDDHAEILATARLAYDEILRRHPTAWLGWVTWPDLSPEAVTPADPDTELDFLLDHTSTDHAPLLALVVPD